MTDIYWNMLSNDTQKQITCIKYASSATSRSTYSNFHNESSNNLLTNLKIKLSTFFASHFLLLHCDWLTNVGNDLGNWSDECIGVDVQMAVSRQNCADDCMHDRVRQQQFTQHLNHLLPTMSSHCQNVRWNRRQEDLSSFPSSHGITAGDHWDDLVLCGWRLSSRTWNPMNSH